MTHSDRTQIIIGDDKHIVCRQLSEHAIECAASIDSLLLATGTFWSSLSLNCKVECCGIHAIDFRPDSILAAVDACGISNIEEELQNFERQMWSTPGPGVRSEQLNCVIDKYSLRLVVRHIFDCL